MTTTITTIITAVSVTSIEIIDATTADNSVCEMVHAISADFALQSLHLPGICIVRTLHKGCCGHKFHRGCCRSICVYWIAGGGGGGWWRRSSVM